jgi:Spy/CpxP family protein refolding chaperone
MHPGFIPWWRSRRHGCGPSVVAAAWPGFVGGAETRFAGAEEGAGWTGGPFGVRRPLRFLVYKLELDEAQTAELAAVLDDLKTERAQAAVDQRRMTSAFADLFTAPAFDAGKAAEAGASRVKSAERLAELQGRALKRVHAILNDEQRKTFAYLLRTGVIAL